jgi:hypothetical protein
LLGIKTGKMLEIGAIKFHHLKVFMAFPHTKKNIRLIVND